MIMTLFGALSAGTKTYLLCRSDRQAFTSAFCNTLPVGCLKFSFSLEIRSSICPFTISFQGDRTESSTISLLAHCNAYWSTASQKISNERELNDLNSARIQMTTWIKSMKVDDRVELAFNSRMTNVHQGSDLDQIVDEMIAHMMTQIENPVLLNSRF